MTDQRVARRLLLGVPVLSPIGSLDVPMATALLAEVSDVARSGVRSLVCDVRRVDEELQDRVLMVLPAAQARLGLWPEHCLHVAGASAGLRRRLTRLAIDRFLPVHETLEEALATAQAERRTIYRALSLMAEARSPGLARRCLARLPTVPERREEAEIVVTELATNALRHARAPFSLALAQGPTGLLVGVTDPSRTEPVLSSARPGAPGGRGIQLVDQLSDAWGVRLVHRAGKTVWARLSVQA